MSKRNFILLLPKEYDDSVKGIVPSQCSVRSLLVNTRYNQQ